MNARGRAEKGGVGRLGAELLASILLASVPMRASAMLVTVISKPAAFEAPPDAAVWAAPLPPSSCERALQTVDALEGASVEARAQYWAYLMKRPGFSASSSAMPGADIANPEIKTFFYSRLRFWLSQDSTPALSADALARLNDASQRIMMVTDACRE